MTVQSESFLKIKNMVIASGLNQILETIDQELAGFLRGIRYVEPLRATAQRYYRKQELAVDELDSKGTNVAMYVDSLSQADKDKLNRWLKHYFSVEILAKSEGGHIALSLKNEDSERSTNLADLGVGFSQIIPIILQLWQAASPNTKKNRSSKYLKHSCVIIEQPELHLHPAYQATIADVMVAALDNVKSVNRELSIIAETHSPHLINRLGELVSEGKLSPNDVDVIMFEDGSEAEESMVSVSRFDSQGVLTNWPYGFFEPN